MTNIKKGAKVKYLPSNTYKGQKAEYGIVTSMNENYVFVKYGNNMNSKATRPNELTRVMNFQRLYELQNELDGYILRNNKTVMNNLDLLEFTILAMMVEVGEFANTTRCFKHWSKKGKMADEVIIEELADVWHFYLSIGNQMGYKLDNEIALQHSEIWENLDKGLAKNITILFILGGSIANNLNRIDRIKRRYFHFGTMLMGIAELLGFTDGEVENAYLEKHQENYQRQQEGY